jgi:hypothetical protein
LLHANRPDRLVVRTSRCGRENPGSTPGRDSYGTQHDVSSETLRLRSYRQASRQAGRQAGKQAGRV